MAQPQKPKRLLYPSALIDRRVALLQRVLRRLYRRFRKGELNRLQCFTDGEAKIKASYQQAETDVKACLERHGVSWLGDPAELTQGLQDTLTAWRGIVN